METPEHKPNILRRISAAVDKGFTVFYTAAGRFIARRPWLVLIICLAITLACCAGFIKFEVEDDAEKLYTPQGEPSFDDKEYVVALYPSQSAMSKLLGLDKAEDGANILDRDYLMEHMRLYQQVMAANVTVKGKLYSFKDVCELVSDVDKTCKVDSILVYWGYDAARLAADPNVLASVNNRSVLDYNGRRPSYDWLLGGLQRDQQGNVVRAEVFQTTVYLQYDGPGDDDADSEVMREMETRITELAYDDWSSPLLVHYVSAPGAIGRESSEAISNDITRLSVGYILLCVYTCVVMWRNSWAYQKVHVALGSFAAIGAGILTAFGLLSGVGVEFNFVCQVLPFLLVGVGVDSTFVIVSAYFDQDPDAPVEHRISQALGLAGSSITVSAVTNIIAFAVGCYTTLPALYSFSIYASVSMTFVFIYQVTLFVACLALDARREARFRSGGGCCGWAPPGPCVKERHLEAIQTGLNGWTRETDQVKHAEAPSPEPAMSRRNTEPDLELRVVAGISDDTITVGAADGKNANASPRYVASGSGSLKASPTSGTLGDAAAAGARDFSSKTITCCGDRRFNPHEDQYSTLLIARWLPAVSLNRWGKLLVLALEAVFLGFAIYGCTQVYMDFDFRALFVPKGNWLHEAFKVEEQYFGGDKTPVAIYTKTSVDGRDYFYYQDQLAVIRPELAKDPYVSDTPNPSSWYLDYVRWLATSSPYRDQLENGRPPNATAFNAWLKEWLAGDGRYTASNVVFNSTGHIISSRFNAYSGDMKDSNWAIDMVDSTRDLAQRVAPGLQAIAFGPEYTFIDGYRSIAASTITNVIIAAAAVFVVTLILLADIVASLEVGLMVVLCDVGVLGSMHYFGLTFNSVTCIVVVLAVGISVDYSAHVMRAFLVATGTRDQRARRALVEIGGAVWNGAVTTFLAVLPMAMAEHYIFTTIFRMFGTLVLLSIWHGVVLLPVLLSWVGPPGYREADAAAAARRRAPPVAEAKGVEADAV